MIKEVETSVQLHEVKYKKEKEEKEEEEEEEEESEETELEFNEEESMELKLEFEEEDEEGDDNDDEEEYEKVEEMKLPEVTSWINPKNGKTVHGVEVPLMQYEISDKFARREDEVEACEICFQLWTSEGNHRMSCLPCGHIFGMSCILNWLGKSKHARCLQCNTFFLLKDVRILYVDRLCIPAADDQKEDTSRFPYSRQGYTAFKQYVWGRLTHAMNKRSDALKQRANVLGRQNAAMEWRANLLNRKEYAEKRANALERRADAIGRVDALRRAGALRLGADALGEKAEERLQKAVAFGQQANALRRRAKAFRRRIDTCKASLLFFKQSYKEFHGFA